MQVGGHDPVLALQCDIVDNGVLILLLNVCIMWCYRYRDLLLQRDSLPHVTSHPAPSSSRHGGCAASCALYSSSYV
jgi:hypothetical protein